MCPRCGQPFGVGPNCRYCGASAPAADRRPVGRGWAFGAVGLVAALVAGLVIWRVADPASTAGSAVGGSQTVQSPPSVPAGTDPSGSQSAPGSSDPSEPTPPSTQSGGVPQTNTYSTGTSDSAPSSSVGPTLMIGLSDLPTDPDPAVGSDGTADLLWRQVFDTLTSYTGSSVNPVPDLASSWQSSDNATRWSFKIAAGEKFHDGASVTAAAICQNYDFWNASTGDQQQQFSGWGYYFYGFKGQDSDIYQSCAASGDSVVMTFYAPMPALPDVVSQITFGIHSPASLRGTKPVGSGSYRWVDGTQDQVQLAAVTKGAAPALQFRVIGDSRAGARAVAAGEVDMYYSLDPESPVEQAGVKVLRPPADELATIDLQAAGGPLTDATVRSGILAALDTSKITKAIKADLTTSPLPGVFRGPPMAVPKFDVVAAKKLLQGKKVTALTLELRGAESSDDDLTIGQLIKAQLAAVGVSVKLAVATSEEGYYDAIAKGNADLWVARTQAYSGDPAEMANAYDVGAGYDPAVPAAVKVAFRSKMNRMLNGADPKARQSLSTELLRQLVTEHAVLPLFSYSGTWVVSDKVSGFTPTVFNQVQLAGVTVR